MKYNRRIDTCLSERGLEASPLMPGKRMSTTMQLASSNCPLPSRFTRRGESLHLQTDGLKQAAQGFTHRNVVLDDDDGFRLFSQQRCTRRPST